MIFVGLLALLGLRIAHAEPTIEPPASEGGDTGEVESPEALELRRQGVLRWLAKKRDKAGLPAPFRDMATAEIDRFIARAQSATPDFAARFTLMSAGLLGVPYRLSPLGEGRGQTPDPDPLIQYAEADCVSLVEISLAFAASDSLEAAMENLARIRYGGPPPVTPSWARRNHLMLSQWIPNAVAAGYLRDATAELAVAAQLSLVTVDEDYSPGTPGFAWAQRALGLAAAEFPATRVTQAIVPVADADRLAPVLPEGAIVLIVRDPTKTNPHRVSHMGIIVRDDREQGGEVFFRHATRSGLQMVLDVPYANYARRMKGYERPVAGVAVFLPTSPAIPTGPAETVRPKAAAPTPRPGSSPPD
jgi:hypothetical protein